MIIVSQSKRMILNLDNILGLGISSLEDKSIAIKMYESNDRVGTTIAKYETAERAQEVLQEIVSKYRQYNLDNNKAVTILPKVYEMPKE